MEPSDSDRELARALRAGHEWAIETASMGRVNDALVVTCPHPAITTYVVKLLDVTPHVGKVKGRRMLQEMGISEFTRVGDLGESQRKKILGGVAMLAGVSIDDVVDGVLSR